MEVERTDPDPPPTLAGTHSRTSPATPELPTRGTEIGRYLVTGEIGRGAMGAVLAAYDADLDRKVAIKLIGEKLDADDERRKRLLGEAKSMARITHPNVVTVYDAGVWHDRLWVAMELVDGVTLDRWRDSEPRSLTEILETFVAAARGLAAAHDAGVLHGDFKPSNVLVSRSGRVVVADFGLANRLDALQPSESALKAPIGTPAYMSPEHFLGGAIDARADQFAFCVALFEQLTGERPFNGRSLLELASAISEGTVAAPAAAKIPMRLRAVVMRGLASRPSDRFASMHELIAALQSAVRPRWQWWLAVFIVVLGGAGLWLATQHGDGELCPPARERVGEFWHADARASVVVQAEGMGPELADIRAEHLRKGVDTYLGDWSALFDEACSDGALQAQAVSQQARVACLENRLAAGRGFVELLVRAPIEAKRVDPLLETLPDLDDCRGPAFGRWEPVPEDPELAREVASLRARLYQVRLRRRAGSTELVAPEVAAILASARASGLSHVVAAALLEQSTVLRGNGDTAGAEAAIDEALMVALREGYDLLAAQAINRRLWVLQEDPEARVSDARQWAQLGEALAMRAGATQRYFGDFHNNLANVMRYHGAFQEALVECRRAEELYLADPRPDRRQAIGARANCAAALVELERLDEAAPLLRDATVAYDEMLGREHPDSITVAWSLAQLEVHRGNRPEALALGRDALARQLAATGPKGKQARSAYFHVASMQASVGDLAGARESIASGARALAVDEEHALDRMFVEAAIAAHSRDDVRALELYTRFLDEAERDTFRDRVRTLRLIVLAAHGDDEHVLAEAKEMCRDRTPVLREAPAMLCYTLGGLAAAALGRYAEAVEWLAWAESIHIGDIEDTMLRELLRAALADPLDERRILALRADRDAVAQRGHDDHPMVRIFDRWLTPRPPGYPRPPVQNDGDEAR